MQRNTPPPFAGDDRTILDGRRGNDPDGSLIPSPVAPRHAGEVPTRAGRRERRGTPWFAWMLGGCLSLAVVLMLFCAALVGTLGGLAFRFASTQVASETQSQSWNVAGAPALRIESDAASVRIVTGPDGQVRLGAKLSAHAASESDAHSALQKVVVSTSQAGDAVSINTQTSAAGSLGVSLAVALTVTVPRLTSVVVVLQAGDAEVDGVSGSISTTVREGTVRLKGVSLTAASLVDVQNGDASVSGALRNGATLDLQVASGNASVTLPKTAPVTVDAVTAAGTVTIAGWAGSAGRNGAGASAHVDTMNSRTGPLTPTCALSIHVQSGDIALHFT
jgi:hypothetical protein